MRSLVAALAAMLPLAAAAQDCAEGLRPFTHAAGTDCIPEAPQRIVTLQDQNGLLPLLELGVTPVASLGHVVDGRQVFRRLAPGMDTSGVEWVGSYRGPIDPEAIAAMSPDLIVASPFPEEAPDLLDDIAPVVVIDMFDLPLTDALMQFADLVGRTDTAEEMRAAFEAEAAEVRAALGDRLDTTTVSFIVYNPAEGTFYPVQPVQATGMVMEAIGLTRTAAEDVGVEREYRAMETLAAHAADVMLVLTFDADDSVFSATFEDFMADPLVQALPVARAGQVFALDGGEMVGSAWSKPMNGLRQIADILSRDDLDRDLVRE